MSEDEWHMLLIASVALAITVFLLVLAGIKFPFYDY